MSTIQHRRGSGTGVPPVCFCSHGRDARATTRRPRGSAVVVMLVMLAILGIFVVANAKRLHQLGQELKIVERRQLEKFHQPPVATNLVERVNFTNQPPVRPGEPH